MADVGPTYPYARFRYVSWWVSGQVSASADMAESLQYSVGPWILNQIRLRLSSAHGSAEDLGVGVSSYKGIATCNDHIASIAMVGLARATISMDQLTPVGVYMLHSGDALCFSMVQSGVANNFSIFVDGWGVLG